MARSYLGPDIQAKVDYTFINQPQTVDVNLFSGELGDRLLEAASFFEIARQTNSGTAVASLDALDGPAYQQTKQALAQVLPPTIRADLLGQNFVTSQVRLIQPLWTAGKITSRYRQALAGAAVARQDVNSARNEVAFNVCQAYDTAVLSEELARVAEEASAYAGGVEQMAQSLVNDGDPYVTTADAARARTFQALFEEQAVGMRVSRERAVAGLKLAMGLSQAHTVEIMDHMLPADQVDLDVETLKQQAIAQRPDLKKINAAHAVATLERKIAKAEFFPNVAAFASFDSIQDDANYPNPTNPNQWAVGVTATLPLYSGGRRFAQVDQAHHAICEVNQQRQFLMKLVEQQVEDAYLEIKENAGRMKEAAIAVESAEKTEESFRAQYEAGMIDAPTMSKYYENLLTTRLILLTAQVRYLQVRFGYNVALAKLTLAVGADPQMVTRCEVSDDLEPADVPAAVAADFAADGYRR